MSVRAESNPVLLLDADGNVFNSLWLWLKNCRRAARQMGIALTDAEIISQIIPELAAIARFGGETLVPDFVTLVLRYMQEDIDKVKAHRGVVDVLSKLQSHGVLLALVTSAQHDWVDPLIAKHPDLHLDKVVTRDEVKCLGLQNKPAGDPLWLALSLLGLPCDSKSVTMMGDSRVDVEAGQAIGATTIIFFPQPNRHFYNKENITTWKPNHLITKPAQLLPFFGI